MNRTAEYVAEIATFHANAINVLIVVVGVCAALIVGELLRRTIDWVDRAERKYRVKHHIRGPKDD
jgi:hypothetical protein